MNLKLRLKAKKEWNEIIRTKLLGIFIYKQIEQKRSIDEKWCRADTLPFQSRIWFWDVDLRGCRLHTISILKSGNKWKFSDTDLLTVNEKRRILIWTQSINGSNMNKKNMLKFQSTKNPEIHGIIGGTERHTHT